ncbi:acylneuraminate cytidylyltransferase family protein [Candidatus Pelagibacter sp.]|jgi:CMP-N,N'-diacetyllegionaminic acid synthase|nr:acylneuraminate cytidylyltransferase family protein [Candidatus Pelagibacter sp.]
MKIIAVIPARSGSRSVKDKNIHIYKKKPLIFHSIKLAKKSKFIDRVFVSTDSKKYQKLSIKFGAEAPFIRPKKISADNSTDLEWAKHVVNYLKKTENYIPDLIVHVRPTSPNRKLKIFDNGIRYFLKNFKKANAMRSISLMNQPPQKMFMLKKSFLAGYFDNVLKGEYYNLPRQFYPKCYMPNGYVDILKPSYFIKKSSLMGRKILGYITPETLDIDTKIDFKIK